MAVEAETRRSYFVLQLARMLEGEGIELPSFLLDLLDKPFSSFTAEDRALYEGRIKAKGLMPLFARLLQRAYEASPESSRHSWRGMYHLLKDSPIKVCAAFVIHAEGEGSAATEAGDGGPARVPPPKSPTDAPSWPSRERPAPASEAPCKSYFTKKLERKLEERGIKVPAAILSLLDKPFDQFTPEDKDFYEAEFKGRQLLILFSDLLAELYEETGKCESGWSAMCRFLKDTPIKLMATYVLKEEERLEEAVEEAPLEPEAGSRPREKYNVRRYQPDPSRGRESGGKRPGLFR
ncbi:MAG: hypothetical protein HPY75_11490 [Actinobacteria bacterium]|nr:hypothetical protein [Actinomycetota bacterium]